MINWDQASTKRGLVWVIGGTLAILCTLLGYSDRATSIMAITAGVAGGLGIKLDG